MLGLVCVTALVLAVVALSRTAAGGSLTERIAALERVPKRMHFSGRRRSVTPKGERPNAGIDEEAHRRERAAL